MRMMEDVEYKTMEVELKVRVRSSFADEEITQDSVRYLVEQDLEDAGWDCDVEILEN